ncbi:platelet-activating factor acetylhydrolase, isoform II-domain-containing protein [Mycena alexandri]|uniref:1-alkyl-2-acetylglycerophosphocholine esterase n=1 Tax=Mycena alexandri TaxID=1745969 RepID=A0AAD6TF52_9AGAR|nr:platelet-activating factor acetylhydrolase, isoform II-domain-containing protein [Mycena alexandri]
MLPLRPPRGANPVGATTFVAAVNLAVAVGSATLAGTTNDPALVLEEIAFTAYYPADLSQRPRPRKGLDWLLRPVGATLRGYSRFTGVPSWILWPVVFFFGTVLKIPVYRNAPLLPPDNEKQWPLVIFSHGLGGSRTAYSQLCTEMAAAGKVVLAIEHRDGTAPACTVGSRTVLYYRDEDVVFPVEDQSEPRVLPLRADQLVFRQHEVYRTYAAFCALVRESVLLEALDGAEEGLRSWLPAATDGRALVNCDDVALVGHSFGGCTVLSVLSSAPPSSAYPALPISKVIMYDPWLEPLPTPTTSFSEPSTTAAGTPPESVLKPDSRSPEQMLVINSQVFSLWKDHFTRLVDVVNAWEPNRRRLLTLVGSQHHSFSDFPVLPLIRTKSASKLMDLAATLSLAFLDDTLDAALERVPTKPMEEKIIGTRKDGRPKRTLVGEVGDIMY